MPPAIRIENLGKRYRVNHAVERAPYRTLRESLVSAAAAPLRRLRAGGHSGSVEDFWALKDVSFDVQPGEVVGIIGRNGAGKSTLLKILSRITKPTTGRVTLRGRVGSLLEVGTGFHPELTGRENVYLNGGILGMSRREIDRNFDAIVDFSGVEKFLDTPVKRYSSGMQVRLAFAVAAHLDPEILIVDEVLAVGDAEFQQKCLRRMQQAGTDGATVLFVSHNTSALARLCQRGVVITKGSLNYSSDIDSAIEHYLGNLAQGAEDVSSLATSRKGVGDVRLTTIEFRSDCKSNVRTVHSGEPIEIYLLTTHSPHNLECMMTIYDDRLTQVANFNSRGALASSPVTSGAALCCRLQTLPLRPGRYSLNVALFTSGVLQDHIEDAATFEVLEPKSVHCDIRTLVGHGPLLVPHDWKIATAT